MGATAGRRGYGKGLFWSLVFTSVFGALIGVPWAIAVSGDRALAWRLAGSSLLQLVPACAVGVWLGPKVGLGSRLRGVVSRAPGAWKKVGRSLIPGILIGLAIGLVVLMGVRSMPEEALIPGSENPSIVDVFLRCLSAGITEEITFRFGLMTFLAWVIRSGLRRPTADTTSLWVGNLLAALIFAAGHLPGLPPDARIPVFLIPILTINTTAGMVMGWLFMHYGLVSAIGSHFVADVVHGVIPRLVALMG